MERRFTGFCGQQPIEGVEVNEEILTERVWILHFQSIIKFRISIAQYELELVLSDISNIFSFIFIQLLNYFTLISCIIIRKTEEKSHKQIKKRIFIMRTHSSFFKQLIEHIDIATMTTNNSINQIFHFNANIQFRLTRHEYTPRLLLLKQISKFTHPHYSFNFDIVLFNVFDLQVGS